MQVECPLTQDSHFRMTGSAGDFKGSVEKKKSLVVFKIRYHYYSLLADYIKNILQ